MNSKYLTTTKSIDTLDFLKALGITLVLLNHSTWHNLQGGVNILLLISGINFARFAFKKDNIDIAKDALKLLKKLLIPSVILIVFYSVLFAKFDWKELLLISNFFSTGKIAVFPVWYVEVMVQLMLFIIGLVFLFNFSKWTSTHPILFSLSMLALALLAPLLLDNYIDSASLYWKLPHYIAWNFMLGWLFWACIDESARSLSKQLLCWIVTLASAYLVLRVYQGIPINRFIIFSACATGLIFYRRIGIPHFAYQPTVILASAVFYIFLLHSGVMYIVVRLMNEQFSYATISIVKFLTAMFVCILCYLITTASVNAAKKVRAIKSTSG